MRSATPRWRRGRGVRSSLGSSRAGRAILDLPGYGDAVALRVHALNIAHIVALLSDASRGPRGIRAGQSSCKHARPRADCRSLPAAQGCSRGCSKSGAYGSAPYPAGDLRASRRSSSLFKGELPAGVVIITELIEASPIAWQRHDAGTRRHADAGCKRKYRHKRE